MLLKPDAERLAKHIAIRLMALRKARGLNQGDLVPVLGVQTAQVSKYEKAQSLITLDNLVKAAEFYSVAVEDFLPPPSVSATETAPEGPRGVADEAVPFEHFGSAPMTEASQLTDAFLSIDNVQLRAAILAHVQTLARL
ncbi:MAG: hypothetical protein Hens3KO_11340 [Henriciella sp.]